MNNYHVDQASVNTSSPGLTKDFIMIFINDKTHEIVTLDRRKLS